MNTIRNMAARTIHVDKCAELYFGSNKETASRAEPKCRDVRKSRCQTWKGLSAPCNKVQIAWEDNRNGGRMFIMGANGPS
jgi:hypothetical protein